MAITGKVIHANGETTVHKLFFSQNCTPTTRHPRSNQSKFGTDKRVGGSFFHVKFHLYQCDVLCAGIANAMFNAAAIKIEAYSIHRSRRTINKTNKAHSLYCYVKNSALGLKKCCCVHAESRRVEKMAEQAW